MKRKRNFLLFVWTLILWGLSSFILPAHAENPLKVVNVALYYNGRWAYTEPYGFNKDIKEYTAQIPVEFVKEDIIYLGVKFETGSGNDTYLPITVAIGDVKQASNSPEAENHYDSVYPVTLGKNDGAKVIGTLSFNDGNEEHKYTLTVKRVAGLDIANQKTLLSQVKALTLS